MKKILVIFFIGLSYNSFAALPPLQYEKLESKFIKAIKDENLDKITFYLDQGIDVNKPFKDEVYRTFLTPLMFAIKIGAGQNIIQVLLMAKANPNKRCNQSSGNTAAHYAYLSDNAYTYLRLLYSFGADIRMKNELGISVAQMILIGNQLTSKEKSEFIGG